MSTLVLVSSCDFFKKDNKEPFEISTSTMKSSYVLNETITFDILATDHSKFDSVQVFLNQKMVEVIKTENYSYQFIDNKFGYQNFEFKIYFNDNIQTIDYRIELVTNKTPELLSYELINTYPHDNQAYTQGLEFYGDYLLESTGQLGKSTLRKVDYKTGNVLNKINLQPNFFGEGLTVLNDTIYQITWQNKTAILYDAKTFSEIKRLTYPKDVQGWGITNDGTYLYMTDGTEKIWKINPQTFEFLDYVNVYSRGQKIPYLNELEWINGYIYANVYQSDSIIVIDPKNGEVQSVINLNQLKSLIDFSSLDENNDVLNGIAFHPIKKTLFVTGKNWDKLFEIKLK